MTTTGPEQPQPRDIALEQAASQEVDRLEAESQPEGAARPDGD